MLAQYQKPERDPAVLERMRAVVERARKELL
jgi:trimethylamine:corrinoid methyltransferase-like protein